MPRSCTAALAALAALSLAPAAQAAVTGVFSESGGDLLLEFSGTLDLTGIALPRGTQAGGAAEASVGNGEVVSRPAGVNYDLYLVLTVPTDFTPVFTSGVPTGPDPLAFVNSLSVPEGYAGEEIEAGILFAGTTYADLGLTGTSWVWTLPNDSITIYALGEEPGPAAVPVPAALPLTLAGLAALGLAGRRRG